MLNAFKILKTKYGGRRSGKKRPVLEQLLILVIGGDLNHNEVAKALEKLLASYIDWNDIRVSNTYEIAHHFTKAGLTNTLPRARRLKQLLQDIFQFEREYTFSIFEEMSPDRIKRFLLNLKHVDHAIAAITMRNSLGYNTTPVNQALTRVLKRLGVIQPSETLARTQKLLDELLPESDMFTFFKLFEDLGGKTCTQDNYDCFSCLLKKSCKTGNRLKKKTAKETPKKQIAASKKNTRKKAKYSAGVKKKIRKQQSA
ncbi:hypothetical protein ACFL54_07655 [Planctomycetota bacterium]